MRVVLLCKIGRLCTDIQAEEVIVEETETFSSQVRAGEKRMSLLQDAIIEIVWPLVDTGSPSFEVVGEGKDV